METLKNSTENCPRKSLIGLRTTEPPAGVKPEPLKVDDNIGKNVSEKRLNTDSYQSFLDELGINANQFTGVPFLY